MLSKLLTLSGCRPTPLASYLKALGVLRLLSSANNHVRGEAADSQARGWWEHEHFHIRTTMDRDALLHYFLHDYAPSPIISPWNGRAGFLEGDEAEDSSRKGAVLIDAIVNSRCDRLEGFRCSVRAIRDNTHLNRFNRLRVRVKELEKRSKELVGDARKANNSNLREAKREAREIKSILLPSLRSSTDSRHIPYIDACYALAAEETPAPLLGSGGNDGSREFGMNFAQKLQDLIDLEDGNPTDRAKSEFESAVFDVSRRATVRGSMGQFAPGQGGPNATTGYVGYRPLNSWDVVLAMEGTLTFAGALTRRWGSVGGTRAAFPFTFIPTRAGSGSVSAEDPNQAHGEIWTPLWLKPATLCEIEAIFAEGRLTVGQRTARTGLDAARSVAMLGLSRGISGFERYSIVQPDSKTPRQVTRLSRFNVPDRPHRDLISDLEAGGWLERTRQWANNRKSVPARARRSLRWLEDSLFQTTIKNRSSEGSRNALMALGDLTNWLARSPTARKDCEPPPLISAEWLREADDGSSEFRIAAALASLGLAVPVSRSRTLLGGERNSDHKEAPAARPSVSRTLSADVCDEEHLGAPPMAAHIAPLNEKSFFSDGGLRVRRAWHDADQSPTNVWGTGTLVSNMIRVLERRLVEISVRGLRDKPFTSASFVRLADVAAFLSGDFDDDRCSALISGLVWARPARLQRTNMYLRSMPLPFAYVALRPMFAPDVSLRAIGALEESARMPVSPGLVARLRAGGSSPNAPETAVAVRLALARARASGLPTPFDPLRFGSRRSSTEPDLVGFGVRADRLAAALLIPVGNLELTTLINRAYPGALPDNKNITKEDSTNVD